MKNTLLLVLFVFLKTHFLSAQVISVQCFNQNDSIGVQVGNHNLIVNGGFEDTPCSFNSSWNSFCPNSPFYTCNIANWTCSGGGSASYPHFYDRNFQFIPEGNRAPAFSNLYSKAPSTVRHDTSDIHYAGCEVTHIPEGYFDNVSANLYYGGLKGVSLAQTVDKLTPGKTYVLEFWAGGGFDTNYVFNERGIFAVDVGFGNIYLRNKPTPPSNAVGTRFIVAFTAAATSHTIKFTAWGSICAYCSELILDDVKLYTPENLPETVELPAPKTIEIVPVKNAEEKKPTEMAVIKLNEAEKQIVITFAEEQKNTSIKITDSQKKVWLSMKFTGKELLLDGSEMKKGKYKVQLTDVNKTVFSKEISKK